MATNGPTPDIDRARDIVSRIKDPEIPVLTIADLGVLRDVGVEGHRLVVTITPTYTGCPAMKAIEDDIRATLHGAGYHNVEVRMQLSPAWTTDWIEERARRKLEAYGIAPPRPVGSRGPIHCPQCRSTNTECISEFGSTACKALYRCLDCLEPFDYFKCI
ncbi:MAG: phenylacetate-CoA oxygenase subunit PaaJ [Gammaproteobacteria bacterium RIFCSPLOWO2_02_FULL_61_13]|nr:MAG: phenylacetate-CoA oxygenase subunit PaaJ [Gammaproteobacteria bacterium RIFCSPLOWO2_02_FULL_61_13]